MSPVATAASSQLLRTVLMLALALVFSGGGEAQMRAPRHRRVASSRAVCHARVVAYYPSWVTSDHADDIPYDRLSHICHAFVQPQPDGTVMAPSGFLEPELVARAAEHGVRVLVSIGGGTALADANFRVVTASAQLRAAFAASLLQFCLDNGYDGVDLDWEYPRDATERDNLSLLAAEIRECFSAGEGSTQQWEISMAVHAGDYYGQWHDYDELVDKVDFFNAMTYDFKGSWSQYSGHHAPLYRGDDPSPWENVEAGIDYLVIQRGIPPAQLNLGIPFYGRQFDSTEQLYDSCQGSCSGQSLRYNEIVDLAGNGWSSVWDEGSCAPYLTRDDGPGVLTYDTPRSVSRKVEYALLERGLGGVFVWEISQDRIGDDHPLMRALSQACWTSSQ